MPLAFGDCSPDTTSGPRRGQKREEINMNQNAFIPPILPGKFTVKPRLAALFRAVFLISGSIPPPKTGTVPPAGIKAPEYKEGGRYARI
jgi:hypothetical protein